MQPWLADNSDNREKKSGNKRVRERGRVVAIGRRFILFNPETLISSAIINWNLQYYYIIIVLVLYVLGKVGRLVWENPNYDYDDDDEEED